MTRSAPLSPTIVTSAARMLAGSSLMLHPFSMSYSSSARWGPIRCRQCGPAGLPLRVRPRGAGEPGITTVPVPVLPLWERFLLVLEDRYPHVATVIEFEDVGADHPGG